VRNGELIPADSRLLAGTALIDYSFVTGESEPAPRRPGEYLYAGGQQVGGSIEVETVKPVSQSYLTSLWNDEAFRKDRVNNLNTLTNRYSRRFTRLVILVAFSAALFWACSGAPARGLKAFTSVLIVACPCALALAAPFALGSAQRLLARQQIFLKNAQVLEQISQVDAIVFDKTGTLTSSRLGEVSFHSFGEGRSPATPLGAEALTAEETEWVRALTVHSAHPHSRRIYEFLATSQLAGETLALPGLEGFAETPGRGLSGRIDGNYLLLGSREWVASNQIDVPQVHLPSGSVSYLAINNRVRGAFVLANALRPQIEQLFTNLAQHCELTLLSGDNQKERARFSGLFGGDARLHFHQSPADKLGFVRRLKESGRTVMMVGDGLNDAGALKQSDVGVAVVEKIGIFSPASDVILEASQLPQLGHLLNFARRSTRVVRASFGISAIYNLIGVSIASDGILSPLICAVLMPLSSISVVLFACGMTNWAARRAGIQGETSPSSAIPGFP